MAHELRANGVDERYCTGNAKSYEKFVAWAKTLAPQPASYGEDGVRAISVPDIRWGRCDIKSTALLPNGTIAGSVATMDRVFQTLVTKIGLSLIDACTLCATTPARELALVGHGVLALDAVADLVVLDSRFSVVQTYISGQLVYAREPH